MAQTTEILMSIALNTSKPVQELKKLKIGLAGVTAAASGLLGTFALFANSSFLKVSAEFEAKMININSLALKSADGLEQMSNSVLDLSNNLKTANAVDLASSLYDIQSAGFSGAEGMQVLEAATLSAAAGAANSTDVTNALVKALNSYGAGADQATNYTNVFQKTVSEGILTMGELSSVIGNATGLASSLNVDINDLGASIALMTKRGLSASESVTKLNAILSAYMKPSKEAKDLADKLNLSFNAQTLKQDGLAKSLENMMKATNGNSEALATLLGSSEAVAGALKLGTDNGKDFAKQLEVIKDNSTAVKEAFDEQSKSFQFAYDSFSNVLKNTQILLGDVSKDAVKPLIVGLTELVDKFNNLDTETKQTIAKFAVFTPIIGAATLGFGSLALASLPLITIFKGISLVMGGAALNLATITTAIKTVVSRLVFLGKATVFITTLGTAIAGASAAFLAFHVVLKNWSKILDSGNNIIQTSLDYWGDWLPLSKELKTIFNGLTEAYKNLGKELERIDIIGQIQAYFGLRKELENQEKATKNRAESLKTYISLINKENKSLKENEKLYKAIQVLAIGSKTEASRKKYLKDLQNIRFELKLQKEFKENNADTDSIMMEIELENAEKRKKAQEEKEKREKKAKEDAIKREKEKQAELKRIRDKSIDDLKTQEKNLNESLEDLQADRFEKQILQIERFKADRMAILDQGLRLGNISHKEYTDRKAKIDQEYSIKYKKITDDRLKYEAQEEKKALDKRNDDLYDMYKKYGDDQKAVNKNLAKEEEAKQQSLYDMYKKYGDDQKAVNEDIAKQEQQRLDKLQTGITNTGYAFSLLSSAFSESSNESIQALSSVADSVSSLTQKANTLTNAITKGDWFTVIALGLQEQISTGIRTFDNYNIALKEAEEGTYTWQKATLDAWSQIPFLGGIAQEQLNKIRNEQREWESQSDTAFDKLEKRVEQLNKDRKQEADKKDKEDKKELERQQKLTQKQQEYFEDEKKQRYKILDLINDQYQKESLELTKKYNKESDLIDANIKKIQDQYSTELNSIKSIQAQLDKNSQDKKQREQIASEFKSAVAGFKSNDPWFLKDGVSKTKDLDFKRQRDNILDLFELGEITLKEKQEQEKELALERYTYFTKLAEVQTVSEANQNKLNDEARQARQDFFELSKAQKEEEANRIKLENQKKEHQDKINKLGDQLQTEINNARTIENRYVSAASKINDKFNDITRSFKAGSIEAIQGISSALDSAANKLQNLKSKSLESSINKGISSKSNSGIGSIHSAINDYAVSQAMKSVSRDFSPSDNPATGKNLSHHEKELARLKSQGLIFHNGGIYGNRQEGMAVLQPREMILNDMQQNKLFNMINTLPASNTSNINNSSRVNIQIGQVVANNPQEFTRQLKQNMPIIQNQLAQSTRNRY